MSDLIPRIVKQHHIFKRKGAGETVMCTPEELAHSSAKMATLSPEEYALTQAPKVAAPTGPSSVDLARGFSERIAREDAARKEHAAAVADRNAEKAQADAAEAKARKAPSKKAEK